MILVRARLRLVVVRMAGTFITAILRLWLSSPFGPAKAPAGRERRHPRVLVMRPDHLGDVLLITPALGLLRRQVPGAEITCLIGPWARPVLRGNPDVDRVIGCPFPGFERRPGQPSPSLLAPYLLLVYHAVLLRRQGPYDAALILRDDHWWGALLAYLAGIPLRVGIDQSESTPFLTVALSREALRAGGVTHRAEENAALVLRLAASLPSAPGPGSLAGAPVLPVDLPPLRAVVGRDDRTAARDLLASHGLGQQRRLVALQAGAGSPLKLWSPEAHAAVAVALARATGSAVILVGSAGERPLARQIADLTLSAAPEATIAVLAGDTSWGVLAALLDLCALVVGADSGTLHLAVARGRPSIALFGPVDPRLFGPWARGGGRESLHRVVRAALPCQPCGRLDYCAVQPHGSLLPVPCLAAITPATVLAVARELLDPVMMEE
ncbi:MAG: glycosyltransferase family 9 protein [Chloroflexota bacterium]